ncbi:hypothetical protein D3C87_1918110 [compost metagenome]
MPQPVTAIAPCGWIMAERIPTAKSQASAPTQPTAPAYQPRTRPSSRRTATRAASRGVPQTAGVGKRAVSTSSRVVSGESWPDTGV